MPKTIKKADARVPQMPTVRFMRKADPGSKPAFTDVTSQVNRVEVEKMDDAADLYALVRLDDKNSVVWRTVHKSITEACWQARHEYGLEEKDWTACE